ncbi:hypothetical protein B0H14DRAFT_3875843 [Mycena olivaceomarginata]|nr:hypothetical protein B0H14DRAFT_3875843 [Mycena olivaceomarginata]
MRNFGGFSLACFGAGGSAERPSPCVGGVSFCGADAEVVCRGPALACGCADVDPSILDPPYLLRGRPVCAFCPCPSSVVQLRVEEEKAKYAFPLTGAFVSLPSSVRAVYDGRLSPYFTSRFHYHFPLSSCGRYQHELDISMHRPRDCGVLLAAPRRPGAGRRRRDVAVPCDDYFYDFSLSPLFFSSGGGAFPPPGGHFAAGAAGSSAQAAGSETTGTEISLLLASRSLRAFLFTEDENMKGEIMEDEIMKAEIGQTFTRKTKLSSVQLRLYAKAETIKAETMVGERMLACPDASRVIIPPAFALGSD